MAQLAISVYVCMQSCESETFCIGFKFYLRTFYSLIWIWNIPYFYILIDFLRGSHRICTHYRSLETSRVWQNRNTDMSCVCPGATDSGSQEHQQPLM
jgi:hypothetical protein